MRRNDDARAEGRGLLRAAQYVPHRVEEALREYKNLNRTGRVAFADHWIGLWARDFDEAWPMLYALLNLVEEDRLYKDPRRVGPGAPGREHGNVSDYSSFQAYFEDRVGRSFQAWSDLEDAYQYVSRNCPEFFSRRLDEVQREVRELRRQMEDGKKINPSLGRLAAAQRDNGDIIPIKTTRGEPSGSTSASYLTRRLVRDHPHIADRLEAGEFTSVHAAAREAGITPRMKSVRIDDPASIARTLRKHMTPEKLAELIKLLQKEE